MAVSIGHTLEKETSVGIYRYTLAEWMVKESILTNTDPRTTKLHHLHCRHHNHRQ